MISGKISKEIIPYIAHIGNNKGGVLILDPRKTSTLWKTKKDIFSIGKKGVGHNFIISCHSL
ncbi:MAG TPA: hypothetical protein VHP31_08745 [Caproicibacter sp.]|nr:hypothetical protein [Caproicibacter sp.]